MFEFVLGMLDLTIRVKVDLTNELNIVFLRPIR